MLPTIELGPVSLSTYGAVYALAMLAGGLYSFHRLVRGGIPAHLVGSDLLVVIWSGVAGALLGVGLIPMLRALLATGVLAWPGGSAYSAGLITGIGVGLWCARRRGLSIGRAFDLGGMGVPLAQAIGRWGCLARGCCYGQLTDSWLGVRLPDVNGTWLRRFPTQLLSSVANLAIFISLLAIERWTMSRVFERTGVRPGLAPGYPFEGFLFLLYLQLYTLKRTAIEFLRADAEAALGPITMAHIVAPALFFVATLLMVRGLRASRRATQMHLPEAVVP